MISLSSRTLNHLADRICGHRQQRNTRWWRLNPGRQALLALAHLRNGDTYTGLAAGFPIGTATAWCYVQEAIVLLSAAADDLATAMRRIRLLAYAIPDGTLIPIDRVADQRPYCRVGTERGAGVATRSVSPCRSPNPACGSHRTGLSTVSAVRAWLRVQGFGIVLPR
jgi:hypothetical protein